MDLERAVKQGADREAGREAACVASQAVNSFAAL